MAAGSNKQGAALRRALAEFGVECTERQAASLADLLLDLVAAGALVCDSHEAVHGDELGPEPSTGARPFEPEGIARRAGLRGGGRVALAENGSVGRRSASPDPDPIVYNMGSSIHRNHDAS